MLKLIIIHVEVNQYLRVCEFESHLPYELLTNRNMKEIKDFFEEIEKLEIAQGVIDINEAKRLVSEAYVAGINFQSNQTKQGGKK